MEKNNSLQSEAYIFLKQKIANGAFEKNHTYSLNALAETLKMSRTPLRDALQKLSHDNIIDILPSRGFRLHDTSRHEIIELYQIRSAIESYCCFMLTLRYKEGEDCPEIELLRKNLQEQAKAIKNGCSAATFMPLDLAFHKIIISAANNQRFRNIIENDRSQINDFVLHSLKNKGVLTTTLNEHKKIFKAMAAKNPTDCQQAMLDHLNTPLQKNLSELEPLA